MYYLYIYEKNLYDYFSKSYKVIIKNLFEINVVKKKKTQKRKPRVQKLKFVSYVTFLKKNKCQKSCDSIDTSHISNEGIKVQVLLPHCKY